ncbi:MAG: hypothetical protein WD404_05655 [Solirubrobacterales bacterium]
MSRSGEREAEPRPGVYGLPQKQSGPTILVTAVGAAEGSRAAAAALACAGSEPDRAGLLIDLAAARAPRPSLVATAAARQLEERLAAHLPQAGAASRGATCHITPAGGKPAFEGGSVPGPGIAGGESEAGGAAELLAAALPLARDSIAVVHLPQALLQPLLADPRVGPTAAMLRADLPADRALTALAARDLIERGLRVAILKRPLPWLQARRALFGASPANGAGLPAGLVKRLLAAPSHPCYGRQHDSQADPA